MGTKVKEQLRQFEAERAAVMDNADLSPAGKAKLIAEQKSRQAEYAQRAEAELKAEWQSIRKAHAGVSQRRHEAAEDAERRFDFFRLNYQFERVRGVINHAANMAEVEAVWREADNNGDMHALRAFAETGAALLLSKFQTEPEAPDTWDARELAREMRARYSKDYQTPELEDAEAEGIRLVQWAIDAMADTRALDEYNRYNGRSSLENLPEKLVFSQGIRLTQRLGPDGIMTSLTIDD